MRTKEYRYTRYFDGGEELYYHNEDPNEWNNIYNDPKYKDIKQKLSSYLPKKEAPTVEDFISNWSIVGADKKRLKSKNAQ